jgi:hypothetical protein
MADLDLRPLSLGEVLDRTFSLYRRNFVLFLGIAALPHLLVLALNLVQIMRLPVAVTAGRTPAINNNPFAGGIIGLVTLVVQLLAYLLSQGGSVFAVSDLYLGRSTTIGQSFSRMRGELGSLFGILFLNGLLVFGAPAACFFTAIVARAPALLFLGFTLLIFPGFYFACRLLACVPAGLLENLGPRDSLERSFGLTKGNVGRAFVIYLLYIILLWAAASLLTWPFAAGVAASKDAPEMLRMWFALAQVGSFIAQVLVSPFLTIAAAVYYYDLRVRKEAFDLQFMMNPSGNVPSGTAGVPHTLS